MQDSKSLELDINIPLIVDFDGSLCLSDSLLETLTQLTFRNPLAAISVMTSLRFGRASLKRFAAEGARLDYMLMPQRSDLIALLHRERERGRAIHLITSADQSVADAITKCLPLFDSAMGSDGTRNLKGRNKLEYILGRFGDAFIYAGDAAADIPIFQAARGAILCDPGTRTTAAVVKAGTPVLAELRRPVRQWGIWGRAFRIHQWSKNLLLFVPLFVGHAFGDINKLSVVALGFALLCLLASATYMLNDLADLEADRLHPTKRQRPFASGAMPLAFGLAAAPLMILASLGASFALSPAFAATMVAYLCLTLAYSFGLKRVPLLDVFVIGTLFTLRIVMGTELIGLAYSPWLLSFSLTFFLSLALAKRHAEIMRAERANVDEVAGRGYRSDDWPLTLTFGIGVGLASVVIMLLYLANDATPSGFYHYPAWLYTAPTFVLLWLMRIWLLSNRTVLDEDPVVFALKDPISVALGLAVAIGFFCAL